jgi:heme/copper-type cytochrome/quinol oxidase subunit 2
MEIIEALQYSFEQSTWVTWVCIFILMFQSVQSFRVAYQNNNNYEEMKRNKDKKGIANFYTAIITSGLSTIVFFLPYLMK